MKEISEEIEKKDETGRTEKNGGNNNNLGGLVNILEQYLAMIFSISVSLAWFKELVLTARFQNDSVLHK